MALHRAGRSRCRTASSRASMVACATNASTRPCSPHWLMPGSCWPPGGTITTRSGRTRNWAGRPRPDRRPTCLGHAPDTLPSHQTTAARRGARAMIAAGQYRADAYLGQVAGHAKAPCKAVRRKLRAGSRIVGEGDAARASGLFKSGAFGAIAMPARCPARPRPDQAGRQGGRARHIGPAETRRRAATPAGRAASIDQAVSVVEKAPP